MYLYIRNIHWLHCIIVLNLLLILVANFTPGQGLQMKTSLLANSGIFTVLCINLHGPLANKQNNINKNNFAVYRWSVWRTPSSNPCTRRCWSRAVAPTPACRRARPPGTTTGPPNEAPPLQPNRPASSQLALAATRCKGSADEYVPRGCRCCCCCCCCSCLEAETAGGFYGHCRCRSLLGPFHTAKRAVHTVCYV